RRAARPGARYPGRGTRARARREERSATRDRPGGRRQHRDQYGAGRRRRDQAAMNISEPFIRRPIATALLMAALLAGGIIGYNLLPVAALPTVEFPTITITASLPGASPEIMASSVAQPLERQFAVLPGV